MTLKPGDKVRIIPPCYESKMKKYQGRIFTVRSIPWKLGHGTEVVALEGITGGFKTDCLALTEVSP